MAEYSSLDIREFQQSIINFSTGYPIPAEAKRLVLSEVLQQMEAAATEELMAEITARDEEEVKAGEENFEKRADNDARGDMPEVE